MVTNIFSQSPTNDQQWEWLKTAATDRKLSEDNIRFLVKEAVIINKTIANNTTLTDRQKDVVSIIIGGVFGFKGKYQNSEFDTITRRGNDTRPGNNHTSNTGVWQNIVTESFLTNNEEKKREEEEEEKWDNRYFEEESRNLDLYLANRRVMGAAVSYRTVVETTAERMK